jgi:hypothetical protein
MKFLRALAVLAIALCLTASVYAETQSVKVSGDLTVRGLFRDAYDYRGSTPEPDITRTGLTADTAVPGTSQAWWISTTEVEIDADLTDNVQTVIRLVNQRDWNVAQNKAVAQGTTLAMNGFGGYTYNDDEFDVQLDLAYVTLKDFIYSPLTLTIGRQDLWFGKGFIIGANQQVPGIANPGMLPPWQISAPEYTAINSFDAIKAVLDYDPWTITGIYSLIEGNSISMNDGINLWGVNVGYKFDSYKAEAEGYWFYKVNSSIDRWAGIKSNNDVSTFGLRGSLDPIENWSLFGEAAYQFGQYVGNRSQINNRDRSAYALDFGGECRYFAEKYSWKPKLGAEFVLYSGAEPENNPVVTSGNFSGWDPMYRGKFDSAIREFVGRYYASYDYPIRANYLYSTADASFTNQSQMIIRAGIQPIESLNITGNYNIFWTMEDYLSAIPVAAGNNDKTGGYIGQEIDLQAIWDYTEDVSFGLLCGWFVPGTVYRNADKCATDIVGTVKVSF